MDDIQRLKQLELSVRHRLKRICVDIAKERKKRVIDKDKLNIAKQFIINNYVDFIDKNNDHYIVGKE